MKGRISYTKFSSQHDLNKITLSAMIEADYTLEEIQAIIGSDKTVLEVAIKNNYGINIVKKLIEKSVDLNQLDSEGNHPLHMACNKNNLELVKLLVENIEDKCAAINSKNGKQMTALSYAININDQKIAQYLIQQIETISTHDFELLLENYFLYLDGDEKDFCKTLITKSINKVNPDEITNLINKKEYDKIRDEFLEIVNLSRKKPIHNHLKRKFTPQEDEQPIKKQAKFFLEHEDVHNNDLIEKNLELVGNSSPEESSTE